MEPEGEMTHQEMVDRLVFLKAMRDTWDEAYESARAEYTETELERTDMPKGDSSQYGEVTGVIGKPTPDETVMEFVVDDFEALKADTSEDFADNLMRWVIEDLPRYAERHFDETGELLDGCKVVPRTIPGQPKSFKYFKVVPSKQAKEEVRSMLAPQLAGLLEV